MSITFVDLAETRLKLLPLSYTRPISEFRVGILKISEKWNCHIKGPISYITEAYLQGKYKRLEAADTTCINSALLPDLDVLEAVRGLTAGQALTKDNKFLAARVHQTPTYDNSFWETLEQIEYQEPISIIERPWDIFGYNGEQITLDYAEITKGRSSETIADPNTVVYNPENVFIEAGAKLKACIIDAEDGPVYIGKNAVVKAGAMIQGPFALCESSHVNMGAKIRGKTTVGPHSKIGGEVSNTVFFGYSNKGHDGFLGNAVLGEWCNLGADTNNSNLKNNYTEIKAWTYDNQGFTKTGLQFCGLIMGDHSKCGINTMFNTGTVVGVGSNIFGPGFPRNFIPSFAWGGALGFTTYNLQKAMDTAKIVMKRRSIDLTDEDEQILDHIYTVSEVYRVWEKTTLS